MWARGLLQHQPLLTAQYQELAALVSLPKQTVDKTAVVFKPSSEDHAAAIQGGQQATLGSGGEAASSN